MSSCVVPFDTAFSTADFTVKPSRIVNDFEDHHLGPFELGDHESSDMSPPSLERYKKLATELVSACKSDDEDAIGDWAEKSLHALTKVSGTKNARRTPEQIRHLTNELEDFAHHVLKGSESTIKQCTLGNARLVVASWLGFASWAKFSRYLVGLSAHRFADLAIRSSR